MPPDYPFTLGRLTNNAALILPPEADQCRSEISPLSTSETFTQRRVRRIGAGSPHANGSVTGARVSMYPTVVFILKTSGSPRPVCLPAYAAKPENAKGLGRGGILR